MREMWKPMKGKRRREVMREGKGRWQNEKVCMLESGNGEREQEKVLQ